MIGEMLSEIGIQGIDLVLRLEFTEKDQKVIILIQGHTGAFIQEIRLMSDLHSR